jgi:addiction module RelB/DinJ family antitoxin
MPNRIDLILPKVYTIGMSKQAIINLKTDQQLKELAAKTAAKLGVSISAVLNNELRRFATEQSVTFEVPEVPNATTIAHLSKSRAMLQTGDYHHFDDNNAALDFLATELK